MNAHWLPFQFGSSGPPQRAKSVEAIRASQLKGAVQTREHVIAYTQAILARCLEMGEQESREIASWTKSVKEGAQAPDPARNETLNNLELGGGMLLLQIALWTHEVLHHLASQEHPLVLNGLPALLREAIRDLNNVLAQHPDWFEELAMRHATWPILYSPHPEEGTSTEQLAKLVGKKYPIAMMGQGQERKKPISFETPSNKLAQQVYKHLQEHRRRWHPKVHAKKLTEMSGLPEWVQDCKDLPDFNANTVDGWVKTGWKAILHGYNGHPELVPSLRALVHHSKFENYTEGSKSEASAIRQRIREVLKGALNRLARQD